MPLSNLNQEQKSCATSSASKNLIIASAGTGKTSVIVGRIAHLLLNHHNPEKLLLLTFTNKASVQMIKRVSKYFGDELTSKIVCGTFHSVSYKLLKQFGYDIRLKTPRELKTLFRSIYENRLFPAQQNDTNPYDGSYLYDLYSYYLNTKIDESFSQWIVEKNDSHKNFADIYEDVTDEFDQLKKRHGYIGFDDLLIYMCDYMRENKLEFDEVLVDEYQDTNPLQGKLLDMFSSKSLFYVGDFDQSIYGFNGSDINIISSFTTKHKDASLFSLSKNYRSTTSILKLASKVINYNPRIYEKKLEVTRIEEDIKPRLLEFDELYAQYEFIATNIKNSNTALDDIAIIYRNNSSADGIEAHLKDMGINSKRKGGYSFFDSKEIKAVLDIMVLMVRVDDMMAFIHIVEYGKNIGKSIAKDIFDGLMRVGNNSIIDGLLNPNQEIKNPYEQKKPKNTQLGLFDNCVEIGSIGRFKDISIDEKFLSNSILKHPKLTKSSVLFLYHLYKLIYELKKIKNPTNIISHIVSSKLFDDITQTLSNQRARQKDGNIDENIKEISIFKIKRKVDILKHLSSNHKDIDRFINAMVLGSNELEDGSGVNLLTIHASKGLEFVEVYIIDLMDGRFPNRRLIAKGSSIEEERRLFYVAVTRAKDILYLSYAKYDKIKRQTFVHSQFLKEAGFFKS